MDKGLEQFLNLLAQAAENPECNGCGWCCWRARCSTFWYLFPNDDGKGICPGLRWDSERDRHWCGVILDLTETKEKQKAMISLSIGAGCCAGLNSWRYEPLQDRTEWEDR